MQKSKVYSGLFASVIVLLASVFLVQKLNITDIKNLDLNSTVVVKFYCAVLVIYVLAFRMWVMFYRYYGGERKRIDAFVDTGLMAVGKYIPGKIWGILSRGAIDNGKLHLSKSRFSLSVAEQLYSLSVGVLLVAVIGASSYLYNASMGVFPLLSVFVLCVAMFSVIEVSLKKLTGLKSERLANRWFEILLMCGGYLAMWVVSALPLVFLIGSAFDLTFDLSVSLAVAYLASMIAGWVSIISPGGIGVRESVFVWLAPSMLTWQEALNWIVIHRILFTFFDLCFGLVAFAVILHKGRVEKMA